MPWQGIRITLTVSPGPFARRFFTHWLVPHRPGDVTLRLPQILPIRHVGRTPIIINRPTSWETTRCLFNLPRTRRSSRSSFDRFRRRKQRARSPGVEKRYSRSGQAVTMYG